MTISKLFTKSMLSSLFLSVALGFTACGQNNPNETPECGNGTIEDGEQCDDGDGLSGDGCSSDCEIEEDECGDGTLSAGEQCDDGNNSNGDGCSSVCTDEGASEAEQINAYIEGLGTLNNPEPLAETPEGDPIDTSYGPYQCTTQNLRQVKVIDSFSLQGGALQERIYPGMLLSGTSLASGNFDEVILPKKPLKLSHDVPQLPIAAIQMNDPSLGSFAQARTDLLVAQLGTQIFSAQSAVADSITTVNQDELSLQLGFDVSAGIATEVDVAGSFEFNNTNNHSRYVVKITNELYTMKIDPVSFASDFFADGITLQQVQSLFQFGAPPVYVDTVTYGREVYVTVESVFSEQELKAALDVAVSNDVQNVDVALDFGLTAKQVLDQTTIKGIAVGGIDGDSVDIGALTGSDRATALGSLSVREAILSKDSLGQPISFTTRYLPSIFGNANSVVDAAYTRENCARLAVDFAVSVDSMNVTSIGDNGSPEAEIRGTFKIRSGQNFVNVFNKQTGDEFPFRLGVINGPGNPFSAGTLQDVDTTFNVGNTIKIEFAIEEDDRPSAFNGDIGDGIDNSVDDVGFQEFTIAVEDLYKNGGQVLVPGINRAGIAFDLLLNFTPSVGLVPVP
jgi:cysteine-rich repeat protein